MPYDAINDFCGNANGLADARRVFTYLFRFVVFLFSLEAGGEGHRREAQNLGIFSAPISSIGIDLECECVSVCVTYMAPLLEVCFWQTQHLRYSS